jgi:diguanylate cyclase
MIDQLEKLLSARQQLKQAVDSHDQWYKKVTRVMICNLQPDPRDLADDAHRACHFGQWYYGDIPDVLSTHDAFIAMRPAHRRMHGIAAELLNLGSSGGVIPPQSYDEFVNALERFRLQLYSLLREVEELIYNRDPLTGAENRVGMLTAMREMLAMIRRGAQKCTIAIMDLDHFKIINDTCGHIVGDQVLSAVVSYVKSSQRPYDRVFRYGGEEFLILLPFTDEQDGLSSIERVRNGLRGMPVAKAGDKEIFVTASFGLAVLQPEVSVEDSIDRADRAMYEAKMAGRNCSRLWTPSLTIRQLQ